MAYKKYIKKGGKIYGPYIYHSRRVDGKVISEYHGPTKQFKYKKFLWIVLGILFLVALIYMLIFPRETLTGRAIFNIEANYQEAQPLEGRLGLSLQEGELIPSTSKLVFENNGNFFKYNLRDLVSEELSQGNFYVTRSSISGTGEGYGIPGEKEVFPSVYFILSILSEKEPAPETSEEVPEEKIEEPEILVNETEPETEIPEETESGGGAPITGNAITNFFGRLTGTGNVVIEFESEIEGEVSVGEIFSYTLQEGERAEIKPRSVRTDSKKLSDDEIELTIEGNEVIVTTSYSESEEGFGREYLRDGKKEISIELSELGLVFEQGDLKVSLVYGEQEILSLTTVLSEGEILEEPSITTPITTPKSPKELEETESIPTETNLTIPIISDYLTEQERAILLEEFGNISVEVKEAKSKKGFIIIRYELGDYWIEFSYDSDLDPNTLESFMEADRVKWLKDIAKSLSEEEEPEVELEGFLGNVSF